MADEIPKISLMQRVTTKIRGNSMSFIGVLWSFALAVLFTSTPFWQLSLVAGFISGLFYLKMRGGVLAGFVGVGLGWFVYMLLRFAVGQGFALLDLVGTIIIGSSGNGALFVFLIALIGGLIGVLGGAIGSGARILIARYKAQDAIA